MDQILDEVMAAYPNDLGAALSLLIRQRQREDQIAAETGMPRDLNYRDAEHWLLSRWMGPTGIPLAIGYDVIKAIMQALPGEALPLQTSTPPDWESLKVGVKGGMGVR